MNMQYDVNAGEPRSLLIGGTDPKEDRLLLCAFSLPFYPIKPEEHR
jgi:hypothetical protein